MVLTHNAYWRFVSSCMFERFHINSLRDKKNKVKVFGKAGNASVIGPTPEMRARVTKPILCLFFSMYVTHSKSERDLIRTYTEKYKLQYSFTLFRHFRDIAALLNWFSKL